MDRVPDLTDCKAGYQGDLALIKPTIGVEDPYPICLLRAERGGVMATTIEAGYKVEQGGRGRKEKVVLVT